MLKTASENFWDCLIGYGSPVYGSPVVECSICRKVHFANNDACYDEGELEELLKKQKGNPEQYIQHNDCDSISHGMFEGQMVVYGCCGDKLVKYENFIINNRFLIAEYLNKRAKSLERDIERTKINDITG